MKQPNSFQRLLSYLVELPVGQYSTSHNPHLKIFLHRGRYKLVTHGAIYSFGDLYSNFRKSFEKFDWEHHDVRTCLVLGLGLGSIPEMLTGTFGKKIRFTAVEIDEKVVELAMEFVLRPKGIQIQVFTSDAASFLEWHRGKYDMICSDVFVGDRIPASLQTEEALEMMNDMLRPNGVLLYNRLSRYEPDIQASLDFNEKVFSRVFPKGGYLDVGGNWMFVSNMEFFAKK